MNLYQLVVDYFWLILFIVWGFPLFKYRSRFRKIVYQTSDWRINFQPRFVKEVEGLIGNLYPENQDYLEMRNFYRLYLLIYVVLFIAWKAF